MKFVLATNNPHKKQELLRILGPLGIAIYSTKELGVSLEDVEETGATFGENAYIKAKAACEKTGLPAISDDSGLCVDALNGAPGVYSARYAGEGATDEQKIQKLLNEMQNATTRTAHFACHICVVWPDGKVLDVEGKCQGEIAPTPTGSGGFGYDPVFTVNGKSFGELSPAQKDALSHRGKALQQLKAALEA